MKLVSHNPDAQQKGELKAIGGSNFDTWNDVIFEQMLQTLPNLPRLKSSAIEHQGQAVLDALRGMEPKDELEGMLAAQLIATHNALMECYRRAWGEKQTVDGRHGNLTQANKLSRTWTTLLDALNKHRGKSQQKMTVEHVHVQAGGQAVVGNIAQAKRG